MRAITVTVNHSLAYEEVPTPKPKSDEVLIQVHAAGVNRADLLQRSGKYAPPPGASEILGLEVAGVVVETGSAATKELQGQRVCALLSGGGYAEYCTAKAGHCMPLDETISYADGAAIPEAFLTAFLNLVIEGDLKSGQKVLIHAAASGVGTAAVQLVKHLGGVALGTAGTDEKCLFVEKLGAARCVNYNKGLLLDQLPDYLSKIDVILDLVGARNLDANLKILARNGALVILSLISGSSAEIDLRQIVSKNLTLRGSTLRDRSDLEKHQLVSRFTAEILGAFKLKKLTPIVSKAFPVSSAADAHTYLMSNNSIGKAVLVVR